MIAVDTLRSPSCDDLLALLLDRLVSKIRDYLAEHPITQEELDAQAVSFAFGNTSLHNPSITRKMIVDSMKALRNPAPDIATSEDE